MSLNEPAAEPVVGALAPGLEWAAAGTLTGSKVLAVAVWLPPASFHGRQSAS
jgi:hypothetical protein